MNILALDLGDYETVFCDNRPNDCGRFFELKWFHSVFGLDDLVEITDSFDPSDKLCQTRMSQNLIPVLESPHRFGSVLKPSNH
jgi:hypothetical protein